MARRKQKQKVKKVQPKPKVKPQKEKAPKEKLDPRIEEIYEREITFYCPIRGLVTQKVKVKRYKPLAEQGLQKPLVTSASELVDKLEEKDSGLSIYDGEELGIVDPTEETE